MGLSYGNKIEGIRVVYSGSGWDPVAECYEKSGSMKCVQLCGYVLLVCLFVCGNIFGTVCGDKRRTSITRFK